MTELTMSDDDWGARMERNRTGGLWGLRFGMLLSVFALPLLVTAGMYLVAPAAMTAGGVAWPVVIAGVGIPMIAIAFAVALWRRRDEMQRREELNAFAAMGCIALILFPVLDALQPITGMDDPGKTAWLCSAVVAVMVALVQRARR